jgi:hypothetical protein
MPWPPVAPPRASSRFPMLSEVLLSWTALCRRGVVPVSPILNTVMAICAMSDADRLAGLATTGLAVGLVMDVRTVQPRNVIPAGGSPSCNVHRRHGGHRWPGTTQKPWPDGDLDNNPTTCVRARAGSIRRG